MLTLPIISLQSVDRGAGCARGRILHPFGFVRPTGQTVCSKNAILYRYMLTMAGQKTLHVPTPIMCSWGLLCTCIFLRAGHLSLSIVWSQGNEIWYLCRMREVLSHSSNFAWAGATACALARDIEGTPGMILIGHIFTFAGISSEAVAQLG